MTVPYDDSFPTEVFTISAWVKTLATMGRSAIIARGEDDNSFNLSWHLYVLPDGSLQIMLEDKNEQNYCYPDTCMGQPQGNCTSGDLFVADDAWHHVAAKRSASGDLALYVDGELRAACDQTGVPSSNNFQDLTIGCTHGTIGPPPGGEEPPIWFFAGFIDEPAMWNRPLSDTEIEGVFRDGVNLNSPGLMGYWNLNEGSGQDVADLSPAGNDGFLGFDSGADSADPDWVVGQVIFLRGDCNGDAQCDIADAVYLLSFLFVPGSQIPPCEDSCDMNDDGTLNIADSVFKLSSLFVPESPPIPPPNECGEDPTADALGCATSACP